jgi:hypothetical protein
VNYVMRHGRRIEVDTLPPHPKVLAKTKRKYFWSRWVKLPRHWITALASSKSAGTWQLAGWILLADNEDRRGTGVVTLSRSMSRGMSRATRHRAARELIELRLITLMDGGGDTTKALKVRIVPWNDGTATT